MVNQSSIEGHGAFRPRWTLAQKASADTGLSRHVLTQILGVPTWSALDHSQLRAIRTQFGDRFSEELRSLAGEKDEEMLLAGLLNLGMRLEQGHRPGAAASVYVAMRAVVGTGKGPFQEFGRQAQARLDVLSGAGPAGLRAEFLLGRLAQEALDPATLAGLTAASAAFRITRLATLSRGAYTAKTGIRTTAALAGFGAEAMVFPLATRLGNVLLGRDLDWNAGQVGNEIASSFLILGALRLTNLGAQTLAAGSRTHFPGFNPSPLTLGVFRQSAMFAGILLGHRLEVAVGLRPHQDGAGGFADSLALLLQFNIAGHLTHRALGNRFHTLPGEMENRRILGRPRRWEGPAAIPVTLSPGPVPRPRIEGGYGPEKSPALMMAVAGGKRGGSKPKVIPVERGALAIGGDHALNWILNIRDGLEAQGIAKRDLRKFTLVWVTESPLKTVLMNDFGLAIRETSREVEAINVEGRIPIRAVNPLLKPDEFFLYTRDISIRLDEALTRWNRKKELQPDEDQWDYLQTQLATLCRRKSGLEGIAEEGPKRYLLLKDGKRLFLPPALSLYPDPQAPSEVAPHEFFAKFRNQFWSLSPLEMQAVVGREAMLTVPKGTFITHHIHPNAMVIPGFAGPLGEKKDLRFFFMQGRSFFAADFSGSNFRDVSKELPPELFEFLKIAAIPKPIARRSGEFTPIPERLTPPPERLTPPPGRLTPPPTRLEATPPPEMRPSTPLPDLPSPASVTEKPKIAPSRAVPDRALGEATTQPISPEEVESIRRESNLPFADTGEMTAEQGEELMKKPGWKEKLGGLWDSLFKRR